MKLELTPELIEQLKTEPVDAVLARLCVAGKLLAPKFESAKAIFKERLATLKEFIMEDGTRIFLDQKPGNREVTNMPEAWHRMAGHIKEVDEDGGNGYSTKRLEFVPGALDESQALECVKISVGDVEKALAEKHGIPLKSKKGESGASKAEALLDGLVERKPQTWLMIS